jgi:hypothetical protein
MSNEAKASETSVEEILAAMQVRLEKLEQAMSQSHGFIQNPANQEEAILLHKLDRLTFKRHAVLTATLRGVGYEQLSELMDCAPTTVKLQLKGALKTLGFRDRATLLATKPGLLDFISNHDYQARFGISKQWWLVRAPTVMKTLRTKKPASNQYIKRQT